MILSLFNIDINTYLIVLARLVCAVVLGGLIGIERGNSKHDAGLRTHIIVCLGAASVMIASQLVAQCYGAVNDVTRLGAQVISGIGFLGVGTIIVSHNRVRGLTTAAGLWTTGCLGLVVGAGFLEVAATIVALMMFTIYVLRPLSLRISPTTHLFEIVVLSSERTATEYIEEFVRRGFEIVSFKCGSEKMAITVRAGIKQSRNDFMREVMSIDGVIEISEM